MKPLFIRWITGVLKGRQMDLHDALSPLQGYNFRRIFQGFYSCLWSERPFGAL
ncbi:MAG: hypothetical protein IKH01_01615 [Prevotella sp.]|nr:hypothetical protein [Prevotella sp.]